MLSLRPSARSLPPFPGLESSSLDDTVPFVVSLGSFRPFPFRLKPSDGVLDLDPDQAAFVCQGGVASSYEDLLQDALVFLPSQGPIRCWFFDEHGLMGRRHYPSSADRQFVVSDFTRRWNYVPRHFVVAQHIPNDLDNQVFGLLTSNVVVLLSHRSFSDRPLCLVNCRPQGIGVSVRPEFVALWFPDVVLSGLCIRWTADVPCMLDGYHLFIVVDDRPILEEDKILVLSGQALRFDVNPEPTLMWRIVDLNRPFRLTRSSDDASFDVTFDDNRYGSSVPSTLPNSLLLRPDSSSSDPSSGSTSISGGVPRENLWQGPWRHHIWFYDEQGFLGMREYPPHLTIEAIENDFLRGWDYTPRFCFRIPDHAKPAFFWQVPMADVVVVQLVLISKDNLTHSGPFCLGDDSFLDDEPITERSFRAVWFHSTSLDEAVIRWVLDAPTLLRGMYGFILINGRALSHSLGIGTPTSCSLRNGDVISFSLHNDDGGMIDGIRYNIPAFSHVPPAGVPASFYDGRFVAERRRRQNSLDAALGSGAFGLEGGGWGIREARSHGLAPVQPLRIRASFYDEFGHLGTREYGPEIPEEERHADYLQRWDVPQLIFEICDYVPSGIVEVSQRDSVRAECVLLSHRVLHGQTLCLFDGSMLTMRRSRRPFHHSQGLHSFWTHTTQVSDPCIRWILDIPRFLDGFYIFVRINSFTLPLHSRQFVPSGACFWLSSRSH